VSREHRRAKTDRLDTELLKRAFLGWLRGERDHCKMVAIPTIENEDAERPNRERESLVGEQTRIVNRMKAALSRLGIRGFNPREQLRDAAGVPFAGPPKYGYQSPTTTATVEFCGHAARTIRLRRGRPSTRPACCVYVPS
jgi:transposase